MKKRITLISAFDPKLNPYIILFRNALEGQGYTVRMDRRFGLGWLMRFRKTFDIVHFHWIGLSGISLLSDNLSNPPKHIGNRYLSILLDALRLLDIGFALLSCRLMGKRIAFTVHDLFQFGHKSLRKALHLKIARFMIFTLSNTIHVHNHHSRRLIEEKFKRKRNIYVIPHGNYIGCYPNTISKTSGFTALMMISNG